MTVNVYGTFNVFNENIETLYESAIQELAIKPSEVEKGEILLENDAYEFRACLNFYFLKTNVL